MPLITLSAEKSGIIAKKICISKLERLRDTERQRKYFLLCFKKFLFSKFFFHVETRTGLGRKLVVPMNRSFGILLPKLGYEGT